MPKISRGKFCRAAINNNKRRDIDNNSLYNGALADFAERVETWRDKDEGEMSGTRPGIPGVHTSSLTFNALFYYRTIAKFASGSRFLPIPKFSLLPSTRRDKRYYLDTTFFYNFVKLYSRCCSTYTLNLRVPEGVSQGFERLASCWKRRIKNEYEQERELQQNFM